MDLATGAVALIILFDIATGQGPPGLNSYLGPPPPIPPKGYLPGPPPQVVQGVAYLPRGEYDVKRLEKPLNGKDIYESDEKEEKYVAKSYDKEDNKDYEKDFKNTTPKPGVFSSFSNSMSDAWSKYTHNKSLTIYFLLTNYSYYY